MLAVTSFNLAKHPFGLDCLEGLVKSFPGKIVAYVEGDLSFNGVEVRDFYSIPGVNDFLEKLKRVSGADGHSRGYDYRYDAGKFCRKTFAQDAVFDEDEFVFWFDADCIFYKSFPEDFLQGLLDGVPFAYLGRGKEGSYKSYTETGFLGFNTKHPRFSEFRGKYLSYFTSGRIFQQSRGWHDCIAFDYAREGIPGNNLSPTGTGMNEVLSKTALAPYMMHLKGNRKLESAVGSQA